jgi:hypothetical protein
VSAADQADMNPPKLRSLGVKIIAETLLCRPEKAASSVKKGETLLAELGIVGPLYRAPFMLGRLLNHLDRFKEALISENRTRIRQCERETRGSAKKAVQVSRKHALYRTWILKSVGEYCWLAGKQNKALSWWEKAIKEGKELGAKMDLARTYFEIGKRLLESHSKHQKLNGIEANGYLEKAGTLFEEMGLERDLDDLKQITS